MSSDFTRPERPSSGGGHWPSKLPVSTEPAEITYPLDLDVGEVARGYHLIAKSISLSADVVYLAYAFQPELADEALPDVFLNVSYDADVPPHRYDYIASWDDVQYARPPREARYLWFDIFPPDFDWVKHFDFSNRQPDDVYRRNRIARLTFYLRRGNAFIEN